MGLWQDYTDYVRGVTDAVGDWLTMWVDDDAKRKVKAVLAKAPNYMETGHGNLRLVRDQSDLLTPGHRYSKPQGWNIEVDIAFNEARKLAMRIGFPVIIALAVFWWWERRTT